MKAEKNKRWHLNCTIDPLGLLILTRDKDHTIAILEYKDGRSESSPIFKKEEDAANYIKHLACNGKLTDKCRTEVRTVATCPFPLVENTEFKFK